MEPDQLPNTLEVLASLVRVRTHYEFSCPRCQAPNEAQGPVYAQEAHAVCGNCGCRIVVKQPRPAARADTQAG